MTREVHLEAGELGLDFAPLGQGPVLGLVLNGDSVRPQPATVAHLLVDLAVPLGESPLLRDVDLRKDRVCV